MANLSSSEIKTYRNRAFELLKDRLDVNEVQIIDYQIDTFLRRILDIPARPQEAPPYQGWMVGKKQSEPSSTRTSERGISMIKKLEGFRADAYMCPANVLTIGYGHTKTVYPGQTITQLEAERLLKQDLKRFEDAVNKLVKVPLTQNQFDALVSFTFNVGTNAFRNSTLLRLLNQQKYFEAANQLHRWNRAGKHKLPGLIRRRKIEYVLFLKP